VSLLKDRAVVLRRLDYSETSQVIAVFTREHGQQRLIAKGIKRGTKTRVAVGVDLLELGNVVFSQRPGKEETLSVMTEWRQEESFSHLRRDLPKLYAAQYAAEVTAQLTEVHDPHRVLFDGLIDFLRALADATAIEALIEYLKLLLKEIGLRPELSVCMSCGRGVICDAIVYFSSRQGGAICRDCEPAMVEKRRVSPEVLRLLSNAGASGLKQSGEAFDLMDYHLREIMGKAARLSAPLRAALGLVSR